jgi:hypothetical protein
MSDGVEEAQNRVLALQRKCSEIERQLGNTENKDHIAEYQADLERQRLRLQQAQHAFVDLSRVLASVRMWVNSLSPGVMFEDVDASLGITCCTDDDYQTTINTLRLEIGDLTRDRHRV